VSGQWNGCPIEWSTVPWSTLCDEQDLQFWRYRFGAELWISRRSNCQFMQHRWFECYYMYRWWGNCNDTPVRSNRKSYFVCPCARLI
jgi:hypothetical protein